jgi:hypothetical protein
MNQHSRGCGRGRVVGRQNGELAGLCEDGVQILCVLYEIEAEAVPCWPTQVGRVEGYLLKIALDERRQNLSHAEVLRQT